MDGVPPSFTAGIYKYNFISIKSKLMEIKTARLTVLIDPAKKKAFEALCARQDLTPSQVVRRLIRDYLIQHSVEFIPSGLVKGVDASEDTVGLA